MIDTVIDEDLRALGADGDAPHDAGVFRDGAAGAAARRDELAAASARELDRALATFEPFYARRAARGIAAVSAAALAQLVTLVLWLLHPTRTTMLLAGVGVVVAYFAIAALVRPIAARRFARSLRASFVPYGDVYAQIDQLSVSPSQRALARLAALDGPAALAAAGGVAVVLEVAFVLVGLALANQPDLGLVGGELFQLGVAALVPAAAAMALVRWSLRASPRLVLKIQNTLLLPGILVLGVSSAANNAFPLVSTSFAVFAIVPVIALRTREREKLAQLAAR